MTAYPHPGSAAGEEGQILQGVISVRPQPPRYARPGAWRGCTEVPRRRRLRAMDDGDNRAPSGLIHHVQGHDSFCL